MTNSGSFAGFERLDANFVWTPNQFLDFCVATHDRGVVRLVGYVLFQTLRLLDDNGVPVTQDISVSFKKIVERAGVSRGAAGPSIETALAGNFIDCVQSPVANAAGKNGQVGKYAVKWHSDFTGKNSPFLGFYSGDGRRTQIPHAFFSDVLPNESLATIRVVAAVIRHTIGYSNQFGGRRSNAPLSYTKLQQYTGFSRTALAQAIRRAVENKYIVIVERGSFDCHSDQRKATTYRLNWLAPTEKRANGSKSEPANETVQKVDQQAFKSFTSDGSKSEPAKQFKKFTSNKEDLKQTHKQVDDAGDSESEGLDLLIANGVTRQAAERVAKRVTASNISKQVQWLEHRDVRSNRAGLLVSACLNDYPEPDSLKRTASGFSHDRRNEEKRAIELKQYREQRDVFLRAWAQQDQADRQRWKELAISRADDPRVQRSIEFASLDDENTHKCILKEMALELGLCPLTPSSTNSAVS